MYLIDDLPGYIDLGQLSEKGAKEIEFDVTEWVTEHPAGTFSISYIRPTETTVYPVAAGDISTATALGVTTLTWAISDTVTAIAGAGSMVVRLAVADTVVKRSRLVQTIVQAGHSAAGDPPDPVADWIADATSATEAANEAAGLATGAISRANEISETMEGIAPLWSGVDISVSALGDGAAPTASITQDETGTSISLGIPKGDTGNDGKPFTYRGDYNAGADPRYTKNDVVRFGGGSFVYINDADSNEPTSSTSHWQQIAEKGDKGDTGAKIVTAEWSGDDMLLTMDDESEVTIEDAKLTLKGDPGDIANIKVDGATKTKSAGVVDLTSDFARYALWRKTVSGNPVSVYPVPESPLYPKVSGTFTQEGTGDPSPDNIRPITPWLESGATATVKRTGKNLLPFPYLASKTTNGITFTRQADGSVLVSGTATDSAYFNLQDNSTGFKLNAGTYRISGYTPQVNVFLRHRDVSIPILQKGTPTATTVDDLMVFAYLKVESGVTLDNVVIYPQLELGSVATPYEPYTETEITLTAPQEIAAGWMDNEGNGQITHGYIASYVDETIPDGWVSSIGELSAGAQVVYPLATPINITPTAAPLTALPQLDRTTPRQNVLTASTGNLELTYAKSPIREADELAAAIAALS